jgi:hypothetical protein
MKWKYAPSLVCRGQEDLSLSVSMAAYKKRTSRFPTLNNKTLRNFSYSDLQHVVLWFTKGSQPFLEEQNLKGVFDQRSLFPDFFFLSISRLTLAFLFFLHRQKCTVSTGKLIY